jgi:hypothetical protein
MSSRPLSPFEGIFSSGIQYAVQTRTSRDATAFADFLVRSIPQFRIRHSEGVIFRERDPIPPFKIPGHIRSAQDAVLWADWSLRPLLGERLATLAIRDDLVVISVSHHTFDGVSFVLCLNSFLKGQELVSPALPPAIDLILASEIAGIKDISSEGVELGLMSRIPWSSTPPVEAWSDNSQIEFVLEDLRPETLRCFSAKTGRFVGLSDALWRSAILTAHALSPGQSSFGCTTWVNLRPYIGNNSIGNLIGRVNLIAEGISGSATIGDLESRIRRSFEERIATKAYLKCLRAVGERKRFSIPGGAFFDVSNVGYFETRGPIVDAFGQLTVPGIAWTEVLGLSSITLFGNENARLSLRYPYSQFVFTRSDALRAVKAFVHSLQNHSQNTTIGSAIDELRSVVL